YLKRNFERLEVNFGCTGGQHRSVFAADSLAKHLQEKFSVHVALHHLVQEEKNWVNG
ncbi:MAG: ATP-binding protein, partial [Chitinophagaceae bacterium]|nr:ATP-binding protein [Chitinophagaceae bacterium]